MFSNVPNPHDSLGLQFQSFGADGFPSTICRYDLYDVITGDRVESVQLRHGVNMSVYLGQSDSYTQNNSCLSFYIDTNLSNKQHIPVDKSGNITYGYSSAFTALLENIKNNFGYQTDIATAQGVTIELLDKFKDKFIYFSNTYSTNRTIGSTDQYEYYQIFQKKLKIYLFNLYLEKQDIFELSKIWLYSNVDFNDYKFLINLDINNVISLVNITQILNESETNFKNINSHSILLKSESDKNLLMVLSTKFGANVVRKTEDISRHVPFLESVFADLRLSK